jgi:myosin heavy subunit
MKAREEFKRLKAVVKIQSVFKGYLQRKDYIRTLKATVVIQRQWRALVVGKTQRVDYEHTKRRLILIQSVWRGLLARKEFKCKVAAVLKIQSIYRGYVVRKQQVKLNNAALTIQNWFKRVMLTRKTRKDFIYVRSSVVKLQRIVRMKLHQKVNGIILI